MSRVLAFYFMIYIAFLSNRQLLKNKRHNFIFIENIKNPINNKISICPLKDNYRNLINQVPT
jgi:hypothetical protein